MLLAISRAGSHGRNGLIEDWGTPEDEVVRAAERGEVGVEAEKLAMELAAPECSDEVPDEVVVDLGRSSGTTWPEIDGFGDFGMAEMVLSEHLPVTRDAPYVYQDYFEEAIMDRLRSIRRDTLAIAKELVRRVVDWVSKTRLPIL